MARRRDRGGRGRPPIVARRRQLLATAALGFDTTNSSPCPTQKPVHPMPSTWERHRCSRSARTVRVHIPVSRPRAELLPPRTSRRPSSAWAKTATPGEHPTFSRVRLLRAAKCADRATIEELIALRKLRQSKGGIDLHRLNEGEKKKRKKKAAPEDAPKFGVQQRDDRRIEEESASSEPSCTGTDELTEWAVTRKRARRGRGRSSRRTTLPARPTPSTSTSTCASSSATH